MEEIIINSIVQAMMRAKKARMDQAEVLTRLPQPEPGAYLEFQLARAEYRALSDWLDEANS